MISVIVPVYNRQTLFLNCLKNLLEQTFRDIEIIVVDDGSEPKITIPEIYSKLVHIFYQENKGAAAARNFGFAQSKGDYLFFCDADVIARPDLLEKNAYQIDPAS
jgi:glycosyltransferase involved in cell wall biosynthesis